MPGSVPNLGNLFPNTGDIVESAYHGTSREAGDSIVTGGTFHRPARASNDQRMGRGVYFWEHSKEAAILWAKLFYSQGAHCALKARIRLGRVMNMETSEHQQAFKEIALCLMKVSGEPVYDAQVFNFFADKGWIHTAKKIHKWNHFGKLLPENDLSLVEVGTSMMICVYLTYLISETSAAGAFANMSKMKADVIRRANAFAESKGKVAVAVSTQTHQPVIGGFPSFDYQFKLVDPGSPEAQGVRLPRFLGQLVRIDFSLGWIQT